MNSLNFCRVESIMNEVCKYLNGLSPDHHFQTKIKYKFWHRCSPVNLLHIFRKPSLRKTSEGLILDIHIFESQYPKTEMFGLDRIAYRAIKLWKKVTGDH